MNVPGMVADLNSEIERLTQIRDLLTRTDTPAKARPSRPKGSGKKSDSGEAAPQLRRPLSEEARKKIAAAQRKRWSKAGKKGSKAAPKPGIVKIIRATPPASRKAASGSSPAPVE